ncbi:MAG: glycoside hydrolase family 99-like domain-containing protein, partial [Phycisphaerae bacterium]|nr:glycoside hydrolase family 99-like domain-containing protein [Phycisphaerae bacterium]
GCRCGLRRIGLLVLLLASTGQAASEPQASLCPNGDFRQGLMHWDVHPADAAVRIVEIDPAPGVAAELDARQRGAELNSHAFPVESLTAYTLAAHVQRIAGDGRFKVAIEWFDADRQHLAFDNSWTGLLAGPAWEPHAVRVIAPRRACFARILAGVDGRSACRMTRFTLRPLPAEPPKVSVAILIDPAAGRAGKSRSLAVRVENRGATMLSEVRVAVDVPEGLDAAGPLENLAASLAYSECLTTALTLTGRACDADAVIRATVTASCQGAPVRIAHETRVFATVGGEEAATEASLPPPVSAPAAVTLGCYYFPVMLDWDRNGWGVKRVDYLEPRLGYYDETLPAVADWHIRWAIEHGITCFVFDWYFNQGTDYLHDALEKGFLRSRHADRMRFCVDWCNEGHCAEFKALDFSDQSLELFIRTLCERYFKHANYVRVEGKPVVLIHQPNRIVNAHGGWAGCRAALDRMRAIAREYGHPSVYFVAVQNNPWLLRYADGGFDGVTAYAYGFCDVPWGGPDRSLPYEALIPRHAEAFETARTLAHEQRLDYIPSAWVGWDDAARSREQAVRTRGNTPAAFRCMVELLPAFVDSCPGLALVEAWNEWGEGGSIEPGLPYGFGYLDAIRDVLTPSRGPHIDHVPTVAGRERLQTSLTFQQINEDYHRRAARRLGLNMGFEMTFDSPHGLWLRPIRQLADVRIEAGAWRGRSLGSDPQCITGPMLGLDAGIIKRITMVMSTTAGTDAELYWATDAAPGWAGERSVSFALVADGALHTYALDVATHPAWTGTIRQLRLDPTDAPAEIAIDRFAVLP